MKISGWQKIGLIFFLFIFLSVNLGSSFLVKPKETKAFFGGGVVHVINDTSPTSIARNVTQTLHLTFDEIIKVIARAFWEEFKIRMINLLTAKVLDFIGANPDNPEQAKFVLDVAEYVWGSQLYGMEIPGLGATTTRMIWNALYAYFCGQPTAHLTINLFLPREREEGFCEILRKSFREIDYTTDEGLEEFYKFLWSFGVASWQGQTVQAMQAVTTYKERETARKTLEYLANQGLRDIKKNLDRCLVWDRDHQECMDKCLAEGNTYEYCLSKPASEGGCKNVGRCLKPQSTVTVPGAVIEQISSSAIHSTVQSIANVQVEGFEDIGRIIAAVIELVANSAIDKIISSVEQEVEEENWGLLGGLGKKHRTEDDFSSDFSEYSDIYGFSTSTPSEEAIEWIKYKEQSKTIIEDQIIPTLKDLEECLIKHNLPPTVDGQSIDSLLGEYQTQLSTIETQLGEVKSNPEEYDKHREKYGSPEDAKDEKDDLLEDFDYYSDKLTECLAKPTPTINCLSIYCDNNNVVTAEFAGDIRDESIVDYRLEIKIDDGDWTYITCSSEPTCNLSQSSCCLTLSQSDETFQATVRYQGQAGKSYSIRMEVENENGWSDWATCSQEQCQIRGNIPPSEESNLLIDTSLPVLADSFGEVISEELKAGLGIALLGATEDQLVNIEITDDEITRSINSLILESPKQFPFENPEIKFETIKISAHILRPVEGNLTLIGELTKKNEKSVNFKIKKGSFNNSLISENLLRQIERKFEERINNFLANIPGLKIESLEVKNGKLVFKGKANQIYVEIEKIITQIKKEDPELIALFLNYLNDRPNDAKGIEKVIKAFQQIESQSLSGSEHSHLVISGKGFTSEKLSCDLPYPFYSKQFKKVFENIVNNDWSETGNWENDWEAVNDAGSFAPFILYKCADKHQNKELERRANKTIDYEISVIDEILKESYNSPEIITKAGGGQYALIAGREHYSGNNKAKVKIYSRIMAIGPSLILIYRPELVEDSLVGAVASISSVANYDFWLAEITKNETERRLYIKLGQCLIDKSLEKYWQEDEYGKYYKSNFYHGQPSPEGPVAFEQGMPLNALARGYKLTGSNPDYFSKIKAIKNTLDQNLWDSQKKGYFEAVGKNIKFLSSHNFITKGYLLWYETTKDEDFLIKATEIFDFIMEDLYSEDYEVFLHDTYTTSNYCSGCNFLTLDNLWRTSEIVK